MELAKLDELPLRALALSRDDVGLLLPLPKLSRRGRLRDEGGSMLLEDADPE